MVEVSLTVGKLDASLALLLTKDHHLIEFPTILLPDGITTGSIVKINVERDLDAEIKEKEDFNALQEEIYDLFGKHEPENPVLKVVNITQTSCVLEWEQLNLGTSELKELTLYKNGSKLGPIKNPFQKKNIKFSGLPIDTPYKFQLKLETSSGIYWSNLVELRTHKMTDLSGITICIGDIDFSEEKFTLADIEAAIAAIGAKPLTNEVRVDTTQFICTKTTGIEYQKAKNMNLPIIRPEWIKACELERRIVGVNKFYLDNENPIWKAKDFWALDDNVRENTNVPNIVVNDDGVEERETQEHTTNGQEIPAMSEEVPAVREEQVVSEPVEESVANEEEPVVIDTEDPVQELIEQTIEQPLEQASEEPIAEESKYAEEPVEQGAAETEQTVDEPVASEAQAEETAAEPINETEASQAEEQDLTEQPIEEEPSEKPVEESAEVVEGETVETEDINQTSEPTEREDEPEVEDDVVDADNANGELNSITNDDDGSEIIEPATSATTETTTSETVSGNKSSKSKKKKSKGKKK